jgi:hypothetical protein
MTDRPAKLGGFSGTGEFWMREERPGGRLDGTGSCTFPEGMTFAEADEAFVLGEPVPYEGLMHDPRRGWYRVRVPVIVSGASCVGEGWFIVTLKIAGEPEDLLAN